MDFREQYWASGYYGTLQEWFNDSLRENGHVRLDSLVRITHRSTIENVRERLNQRWEPAYLIEIPVMDYDDAHEQSAKLIRYLTENETDLGEWTSFLHEGKLVFAFRSDAAAIQFRLIWP
jgi:hypothetical protein